MRDWNETIADGLANYFLDLLESASKDWNLSFDRGLMPSCAYFRRILAVCAECIVLNCLVLEDSKLLYFRF